MDSVVQLELRMEASRQLLLHSVCPCETLWDLPRMETAKTKLRTCSPPTHTRHSFSLTLLSTPSPTLPQLHHRILYLCGCLVVRRLEACREENLSPADGTSFNHGATHCVSTQCLLFCACTSCCCCFSYHPIPFFALIPLNLYFQSFLSCLFCIFDPMLKCWGKWKSYSYKWIQEKQNNHLYLCIDFFFIETFFSLSNKTADLVIL